MVYDPKKHGFGDSLNIKDRQYPKEGEKYTVVNADNLLKISEWAYGYNRVKEIINANPILQERINNGRIHGASLGGIPIVFVGDVLMIPFLSEQSEVVDIEDIYPDRPDNVVIRINGIILYGFTVNSMQRSIKTIADSFSFSAPYNPEDQDSQLLDAYTYYKAELFIDGKLFMLGVCETWDFAENEDSTIVSISVRAKAGVLVDCPSTNSRLSYTNQTFSQIATNLLNPFGIRLETPHGDTGIINKIKRNTTDKVFEFIAKLAKNKGFILNSSRTGNIILDRANIDSEPVLNLIQGDHKITNLSAKYDGQKRFSSFKAISQKRGKANISSNDILDNSISAYRPNIFSAENNDNGEINNAASWERSRSLANSATVSISFNGWRDKNNEIILENKTVTLYAPKIGIHIETKFLIESVSYSQNPKSVNLSLSLPQAYTLEFPEEYFWQRS